MTSETLTGKEALFAILEGTHWWISEEGHRLAFIGGRFEAEYRFYALWGDYQHEMDWTRGEPIEVSDE